MHKLMSAELVSGYAPFKLNELRTAIKLESYIPITDFKALSSDGFFDYELVFFSSLASYCVIVLSLFC